MRKTIGLAAAAALVLTAIGVAQADVSKKVQAAFRGQILITNGPPPEGGSDAETIAAMKKARLAELPHTEANDVAEWSFDYTAFLNKAPKTDTLSFDFYTADKDKLYVANKRLTGIDPDLPILTGSLSITEDDGLNRNRKYLIKLTGKVKGKEVVFAETTVKMK